ncbi:MAG: alpha/beta hydrolase-fold protein [Xanthomonadales bacterium]
MNIRHLGVPLALSLLLSVDCVSANGALQGPNRISSTILGYDLQYWVYMPEDAARPLPELYVTDGQAYLGAGRVVEVLDREYEAGRILPFAVVFVDSRDPDAPDVSRRNREFMCNVDYAKFYAGELMPAISSRWTGAGPTTPRGIMGVSFGGINSACFGMLLPGVFQLLIMHSPASDEHLRVIEDLYRDRPRNPSALFVSHGGPDDNEQAARRFIQTLKDKGYAVQDVATGGGHGWKDWRPLIDDSLRAFSARIDRQTDAAPAPATRTEGAGNDGA